MTGVQTCALPIYEAQGAAPVAEPPKKRRFRDKMTSPAWEHFEKGEVDADGFYDAKCIYCGHVIIMGNGKGTSSMDNHWRRACTKIPAEIRKSKDPKQKLLKAYQVNGNVFVLNLNFSVLNT